VEATKERKESMPNFGSMPRDMNSPVPVQEYIDTATQVRLIVRGDVLGVCDYELHWCEYGKTSEEINEAIGRLMTRAGLTRSDKER
jgi:hypothetical protein